MNYQQLLQIKNHPKINCHCQLFSLISSFDDILQLDAAWSTGELCCTLFFNKPIHEIIEHLYHEINQPFCPSCYKDISLVGKLLIIKYHQGFKETTISTSTYKKSNLVFTTTINQRNDLEEFFKINNIHYFSTTKQEIKNNIFHSNFDVNNFIIHIKKDKINQTIQVVDKFDYTNRIDNYLVDRLNQIKPDKYFYKTNKASNKLKLKFYDNLVFFHIFSSSYGNVDLIEFLASFKKDTSNYTSHSTKHNQIQSTSSKNIQQVSTSISKDNIQQKVLSSISKDDVQQKVLSSTPKNIQLSTSSSKDNQEVSSSISKDNQELTSTFKDIQQEVSSSISKDNHQELTSTFKDNHQELTSTFKDIQQEVSSSISKDDVQQEVLSSSSKNIQQQVLSSTSKNIQQKVLSSKVSQEELKDKLYKDKVYELISMSKIIQKRLNPNLYYKDKIYELINSPLYHLKNKNIQQVVDKDIKYNIITINDIEIIDLVDI